MERLSALEEEQHALIAVATRLRMQVRLASAAAELASVNTDCHEASARMGKIKTRMSKLNEVPAIDANTSALPGVRTLKPLAANTERLPFNFAAAVGDSKAGCVYETHAEAEKWNSLSQRPLTTVRAVANAIGIRAALPSQNHLAQDHFGTRRLASTCDHSILYLPGDIQALPGGCGVVDDLGDGWRKRVYLDGDFNPNPSHTPARAPAPPPAPCVVARAVRFGWHLCLVD